LPVKHDETDVKFRHFFRVAAAELVWSRENDSKTSPPEQPRDLPGAPTPCFEPNLE
jgi:hypothetical protein